MLATILKQLAGPPREHIYTVCAGDSLFLTFQQFAKDQAVARVAEKVEISNQEMGTVSYTTRSVCVPCWTQRQAAEEQRAKLL